MSTVVYCVYGKAMSCHDCYWEQSKEIPLGISAILHFKSSSLQYGESIKYTTDKRRPLSSIAVLLWLVTLMFVFSSHSHKEQVSFTCPPERFCLSYWEFCQIPFWNCLIWPAGFSFLQWRIPLKDSESHGWVKSTELCCIWSTYRQHLYYLCPLGSFCISVNEECWCIPCCSCLYTRHSV